MKKAIIYLLLWAIPFLLCHCKCDISESCLATYIEENEPQLKSLRNWDIFFESERDFWSCKHWYSRDSLLACIFVYVDKYNNFISYDINSLHEDSITAVQMASQNIGTLQEIQKICKAKDIGTHEVELFNDTLEYAYAINVVDKEKRYQILYLKCKNNTIGNHLYGKWYSRKKLEK